jgi:hypothetical protein
VGIGGIVAHRDGDVSHNPMTAKVQNVALIATG